MLIEKQDSIDGMLPEKNFENFASENTNKSSQIDYNKDNTQIDQIGLKNNGVSPSCGYYSWQKNFGPDANICEVKNIKKALFHYLKISKL